MSITKNRAPGLALVLTIVMGFFSFMMPTMAHAAANDCRTPPVEMISHSKHFSVDCHGVPTPMLQRTAVAQPSGGFTAPDPNATASAEPPASTEGNDDSQIYGIRNPTDGHIQAVHQGEWGGAYFSYATYRTTPGASREGFMNIVDENRSVCRETGSWITESTSIIGEAQSIGREYDGIAHDLVGMAHDIDAAAHKRLGTEIFGTALLCAIPGAGWLYCGGAAMGALGNEIQSQSHDRSMRLNTHMANVNVRQSKLQLRATVLTMRENIGWSKMMQSYCLKSHLDATLDGASAARAEWTPAVAQQVNYQPANDNNRRHDDRTAAANDNDVQEEPWMTYRP